MLLPVTLVIAGACALINLWLAVRLVRGRLSGKIMVGDGGVPAMASGMRAHANFIEYAPIVLILIALIELARGPSPWLWALGVVFILARIAHPFGMDRPAPNPFRAVGALGTWVVTAILAGWALLIAYQAEATQPAIEGAPVEIVPSA